MSNMWIDTLLHDLRNRCSGDSFMLEGLDRLATAVASLEHYIFRSSHLEQLSDNLLETSTNQELAEVLKELAYEIGFRSASAVIVEHGTRTPKGARVVTICGEKWIENFIFNNKLFLDPIIERARAFSGPISFPHIDSENKPDRHRLDEQETVAFSVHMPDGAKGVVYFHDPVDDDTTKSRRHHKISDAFYVCRDLLLAHIEINTAEHALESLSDSEKEFLALLTYSSNPKEALSIFPKFGSNTSLQKELMKKLGVKSLFQASAVAAKLNLIDYVRPRREDISTLNREMSGVDFLNSDMGDFLIPGH